MSCTAQVTKTEIYQPETQVKPNTTGLKTNRNKITSNHIFPYSQISPLLSQHQRKFPHAAIGNKQSNPPGSRYAENDTLNIALSRMSLSNPSSKDLLGSWSHPLFDDSIQNYYIYVYIFRRFYCIRFPYYPHVISIYFMRK